MRKIGKKKVIETLKEIVAEHGEDYVYPHNTCEYVDEESGAPRCIVGHVLVRLDLLDQNANIVEDNTNAGGLDGFTPLALSALQAAQMTQDGVGGRETRRTWGEALRQARAAA